MYTARVITLHTTLHTQNENRNPPLPWMKDMQWFLSIAIKSSSPSLLSRISKKSSLETDYWGIDRLTIDFPFLQLSLLRTGALGGTQGGLLFLFFFLLLFPLHSDAWSKCMRQSRQSRQAARAHSWVKHDVRGRGECVAVYPHVQRKRFRDTSGITVAIGPYTVPWHINHGYDVCVLGGHSS